MDIITLTLAKKYAREKIYEAETLGWNKKVVESLPTTNQSNNTIYLVKNGDLFNEYIWDQDSSEWIALGSVGVAGDKTFSYIQLEPETNVIIRHDLGKRPSVTAIDSDGNNVLGEIEYTDSNTLSITFNPAFTGNIYLN